MQAVAQPSSSLVDAPVSYQKTSKRYWRWPIWVGLAAVLLYFALRGVEWRRVANIVAHCRIAYLFLACGCGTVSYLVRAMRWRVLLNAQEKLKPATVLWASSVGYLGNSYLLTGSGELLRTLMISSRSKLSRAYVFTTVMTERAVELIILVVMASLASLTLSQRPSWLMPLLMVALAVVLLGTAGVVLLPKIERSTGEWIGRMVIVRSKRARLRSIAERVTIALGALRVPSRTLSFCGLGFLVWSLDATAGIMAARSLSMKVSVAVFLILLAGLYLGSVLSGMPGALGTFQFVAVTVLVPFGFTKTDAIAFILVQVVLGYVIVTALGLIGLWRYHATPGQRTNSMG